MLIAEKRIPEDTGMATVIVAKQREDRRTKQARLNGTHALTEIRGVYAASGSGVHAYTPRLSAEAQQPTPFMSLSWAQWLEVQAQMIHGLERFLHAAEEHRADEVLNAGMEMQAALYRVFLEAHVMGADLGLQELPHSEI